jgi:hypothetical protein
VLTSATVQGGQDAVPGYGCKTPPTRLVLPPLVPHLAPDAKGIMVWRWPEPSAAGYELAGHAWPEQRGTALDRLTNVAVEIIGLSQRRAQLARRPSRRRRPRTGSAFRQRGCEGSRRPVSTSWRTSCSECEDRSTTIAASPRPSGPSLTGPHTWNSCIQEVDTPERRADQPATPHSIRKPDAKFRP